LKRICFVIPSLSVGGTEMQLCHLTRGLLDAFEVTVVCTRRAGALAADLRRAGVYMHVLEGANRFGGWDPMVGTRLRKIFRRHRPDILHTFLFGFDLAANRAARESGVPVIVSSRREMADWKQGRHLRLQRRANQLTDCIIANSRAVAENAIRQEQGQPDKYKIIPNGIPADAYLSIADQVHLRDRFKLPPARQIVGIVANLAPVKDHDLFLRIAAVLARSRKDVHFLIVGAGPLRERILRTAARLGLAERVTQIASIAEVPDLYSVMDVCVLCSKAEGMPNAVMEAMAAGKPVVATAVGGLPELIEDGVTGRLLDSRDPAVFAEVIGGLLDSPSDRAALGRQAAKFVRQQFSVKRMVEAHRELYNQLLASMVSLGA
jgi:L-malate glycosyltransferase